ncbi:MAG: hypothetical protein M1818_003491 [Claussenomyces sp. TS43310]|nr:MAG: hypothetical protein M1818_003491 [Claussenomyces sp. TS43310]
MAIKLTWQGCVDLFHARCMAIWANLHKDHLWQRMLKNTLATTITVILAFIPAIPNVYGKAIYLAPITTVFGHPGRRLGMMVEALALAVAGTLLGTAWSTLGVYLSSLVYDTNRAASYTIKGIFLAMAILFHGILRSHTPRLFIFVLLLVIVSVVTLTGTATAVSSTLVTTILYPILTAVAILLLVNVCVFPEFSSSFIGITTIETLDQTIGAVRDAGTYFIAILGEADDATSENIHNDKELALAEPAVADGSKKVLRSLFERIAVMMRFKSDRKPAQEKTEGDEANPAATQDTNPKEHSSATSSTKIKLKTLTNAKAKLRTKLASCKAAQTECNFELAFSVLPPRDLKPISDTHMKKLVANAIALIGACESKFALMGDDEDGHGEIGEKAQLKDDAAAANVDINDTSSRSTPRRSSDELAQDEGSKPKSSTENQRKQHKSKTSKTRLERDMEDLELIKPRREIEFGNIDLLVHLVKRLAGPLTNLQDKIDQSVNVITSCLAYSYDVPRLPSGARPPKGIELQEIDIRIDILSSAMADFDRESAAALEGAASLEDLDGSQFDIMPRLETFLVSSFLLNLRQAALHTQEMLNHARKLVEKRQARHERRRLYAPRINWRKWLTSGGESDMLALPEQGRKDARTGTRNDDAEDESSPSDSAETLLEERLDEEAGISDLIAAKQASERPLAQSSKITKQRTETWLECRRVALADFVEYLTSSEDVLYAIKLTVAVILVTWPAFLAEWNAWYSQNRGLWAALQLVLITEVAIGTSVMTFFLRAVGTTIGCLWGYAAYESRSGNPYTCVVLLVIGIVPSTYIQLGSKYIKAGMVSIISMCIVALATVDHTVAGSATENFLRRWIAFLIGGTVALLVEVVLFPVKARDRLVESLAASIRHISEMEGCLAHGVESESNVDVHSPVVSGRFESAKSKAQGSLTAAETFLPFCAQEPRLKGSFASLALVYAEIVYVLHQIVDRMDNMLQIRRAYGSGVLEELNTHVYPYRRNVAGSITLVFFAVHEALTTKLALPQFLPSARLAHLRMINRVREIILVKGGIAEEGPKAAGVHPESMRSQVELALVKRIVRQKFLSWNAASAAQIEIIEYLEELIDLTKLLVGANEFRSGILTRPSYWEYVSGIRKGMDTLDEQGGEYVPKETHGSDAAASPSSLLEREHEELRDAISEPRKLGMKRAATARPEGGRVNALERMRSGDMQRQDDSNELPLSLQRVRSRRLEDWNERMESVKNQRSREEPWTSGRDGKRPRKVP